MPTYKSATLNGLAGQGYAEERTTPGGLPEYVGVFIPDSSAGAVAAMSALIDGGPLTFHGTVYTRSGARAATFPVLLSQSTFGSAGSGITFAAEGNPFEEPAP